MAFTRDGQCFLVGTSDDAVRLFDKSTGEMLQEYTGHRHKKYRIDSVMDRSDQGCKSIDIFPSQDLFQVMLGVLRHV